MALDDTVFRVTERIIERSATTRQTYLDKIARAQEAGVKRAHLSCGNQAHAYAAMGDDKTALVAERAPNIGIITAYNDMLSAHQPLKDYPDRIKSAVRKVGATAQVAGGVPAMCDGVTQGQPGMELSLFSRDIIALATGVALSHNTFDAAMYLGVCDKIVPGLIIAAGAFGHLPGIFVPAGPMTSGLPNDEKAKVRTQFAAGEVGRDKLMEAEMASYHGPGTCTFYGTANTNQMLMEFMGLHMPGASFVNPGTPLRDALTEEAAQRAAAITAQGNDYRPVADILDARAFVNGIVGLMATGGSTN
ncbi:MAG: dihydroxy-acid dehydratase, partial [Pseudomonadota bacterium]